MVKCYCIKGCGNKKRKDKMFRVGTASSVSLHFLNSLSKTFPSDPTLYCVKRHASRGSRMVWARASKFMVFYLNCV